MHTYLLVGLAKNGGFIFPKPLCVVRASSLSDAAVQLGGRLHDVAKSDGRYDSIFMPDAEYAAFHGGTSLGAKIGAAFFGENSAPSLAEDAEMIRRVSENRIGLFSKLLIGRMPVIG